jgi:hypothetical protein
MYDCICIPYGSVSHDHFDKTKMIMRNPSNIPGNLVIVEVVGYMTARL